MQESELYQKLIVFFGKPITVTPEDGLFHQTEVVQDEMVRMRTILWEELGVKRETLDDIDQDVYLNHVYLKKFKALGYTYDSEYESQFLLRKINEYYINDEGLFVPGITTKSRSK